MTDFRIFAHGKEFDPDACASRSALKFSRLWRRGELKCPDGTSAYETSGVEILLAAEQLPFYSQVGIARSFLEENETALQKLGQFDGVETYILGLERTIEHSPGLVGFTVWFPESLMSLSLRIGINLVAYVQLAPLVVPADA